jgi:hypothetical protein
VLYEGGWINFEDVEAFTIDLLDRFSFVEAAYDPRYLDRSAEFIVAGCRAIITVLEPSSKLMRAAPTAFERGVIEGVDPIGVLIETGPAARRR